MTQARIAEIGSARTVARARARFRATSSYGTIRKAICCLVVPAITAASASIVADVVLEDRLVAAMLAGVVFVLVAGLTQCGQSHSVRR